MIYPKKISIHKSDTIIRILTLVSVLIAGILILINKLTTPDIPWAALANSGIIYVWIVVLYSVKKKVHIAGHSLLQLIVASGLTLYIDYSIGFRGWSLEIAIPIIIMTANIVMFVLTIVSFKKYIRYAICQLIIVLLSMAPLVLLTSDVIENKVLSIIAVSISCINLVITIILSFKDVKEAIVRRFHI